MKTLNFIVPFLVLACVPQAGAQEPATLSRASEDSAKALVQPGLGTLKQDEFTIGIRSDHLLVKVTPLNEQVIRLAAPDTYKRLNALAASRRADAIARANAEAAELFLVSFFSYQPDVEFNPEALQLDYNGQLLRPAAILPLTPSWGRQRLGQQEMQAAIYVFSEPIDFQLPMVLKYGFEESREWQRVIPRLQVERNKIKSRGQT
ncbi:MAG: hypothetical protein ACT443_03035 [Gemmatimonadota bacterium]